LESGYAYSTEESLQHAKEGVFKTERAYPWEMSVTPNGFYKSKENRVAAVKWLVAKLEKDPRDLTQEDFNSNRLCGLMDYYNGSPYAALTEAGYQINTWEMIKTPMGFYESKENRAAATRWLVQKLQKDPRYFVLEDFNSNRLGGLLATYHKCSPHAALTEAGYQINPWEMLVTPHGFYDSKENRAAATRWLAQKLQKAPRDITKGDFESDCLGGLLANYYRNCSYAALLEAELVTPADEAYMRRFNGARFLE
jgi:hypothetical protein